MSETLQSPIGTGDISVPSPNMHPGLFDREIDRRTFCQYLGLTGLATTWLGSAPIARYEADKIGHDMDERWPVNKPSFTFLDGEKIGTNREIAIFFPGFGDMHSEAEAELLRAEGKLPETMPVAFVDYSNQGATITDLTRLIRGSVDTRQLKSLTVFGRSMGGPVGLNVAAELGVPVKSLMLCSSPFDLSDGDFGGLGAKLSGLKPYRDLDTLVKFGINTWEARKEYGWDIFSDVAKGWAETMTGANPLALHKELRVLHGIDLNSQKMVMKMARILNRESSRVVYTGSEDPSSDHTVHIRHAANKYDRLLRVRLGLKHFRIMGLPYQGHANMAVTVKSLQHYMAATYATPQTQILASK